MSATPTADVRKAYLAQLDGASPRRGLQHRSLVLVALVLRDAPAAGGLAVDPADVTWVPGEGKDEEAVALLSRPAAPAGEERAPIVLPSGFVLRAGDHERLLERPVLLGAGRTFGARTVPLRASDDAEEPEYALAGIAPPAYQQTLFLLRERDALTDLLDLQGSALGLDPKATPPTLAALTTQVDVDAKVRQREATDAVRALGGAYGGETVGHVAFLGTGVVQTVLAASPETYQSWLVHAADGLGLAVTAWEALYGVGDDPPPPVTWDDYVRASLRLVTFLGAASFKRQHRSDESGDGGELWRVRATKATRGGRPQGVGWLLLDAEGQPVCFEAWPDHAPLPPPPGRTRTPRRAVPDEVKSGANTWYWAKRFADRFPWRREPWWVRLTPRPPLDDGR